MGHYNACHAEVAGQFQNELIDLSACDGIESGTRFVIEKNFRIHRHCPRKSSTLHHSSRNLRRKFVGMLTQSDKFQFHLDNHLDGFWSQISVLLQRQRNIVSHRHRLKERARLKENSELFLQRIESIAIERCDVLAKKRNRSARRLMRPDQQAQQCGLSTSRTTHNDNGFSSCDVQIHASQNGLTAKLFNKVANGDSNFIGGHKKILLWLWIRQRRFRIWKRNVAKFGIVNQQALQFHGE